MFARCAKMYGSPFSPFYAPGAHRHICAHWHLCFLIIMGIIYKTCRNGRKRGAACFEGQAKNTKVRRSHMNNIEQSLTSAIAKAVNDVYAWSRRPAW